MTETKPSYISKERWLSFSLLMRMGHIGSEVMRFLSAREKGEKEREKNSFARTMEMVDFTLEDPTIGNRKKEIEILKEVLEDMESSHPKLEVTNDSLRDYFTQFAMLYSLSLQKQHYANTNGS